MELLTMVRDFTDRGQYDIVLRVQDLGATMPWAHGWGYYPEVAIVIPLVLKRILGFWIWIWISNYGFGFSLDTWILVFLVLCY